LHQDHDTLNLAFVDRESHDISPAYSLDVMLDRQFEILRPHVTAVDEDEILAAPGNYERPTHEIPEIARLQPAVG
jgi:hypothetical protein